MWFNHILKTHSHLTSTGYVRFGPHCRVPPKPSLRPRQEDGTVVAKPTGEWSMVPQEIVEAREREQFGGGSSGLVMSGGGAKRWT